MIGYDRAKWLAELKQNPPLGKHRRNATLMHVALTYQHSSDRAGLAYVTDDGWLTWKDDGDGIWFPVEDCGAETVSVEWVQERINPGDIVLHDSLFGRFEAVVMDTEDYMWSGHIGAEDVEKALVYDKGHQQVPDQLLLIQYADGVIGMCQGRDFCGRFNYTTAKGNLIRESK